MLFFEPHITNLVTKANKTRALLYPILNKKSPLSLKSKLNIHQLYIRPVVPNVRRRSMGFPTIALKLVKLEKTQNIILRLPLGKKNTHNY